MSLCLVTQSPADCLCRYIRYIYNRIILENATVRAAAVSALANFGANVPELSQRVVVLLKRALFDNDDEVRCGGSAEGLLVASFVLCALIGGAALSTPTTSPPFPPASFSQELCSAL